MGRLIEHTKILSGLISACMMLVFRNKLSDKNNWWEYARTARMLSPTSLPKRLTTSRRFMLCKYKLFSVPPTNAKFKDERTSLTRRRDRDGHDVQTFALDVQCASYRLDQPASAY